MLRDRGQLTGKPLQSLREANLAKHAQKKKNWAWLPTSICLSAIGQFIFYICQAIVTVVTWEHLGAYSCRTSFGSIQIPCFSLATKYFLVSQKRGVRVSVLNIYSRISYPWVSEDDYFYNISPFLIGLNPSVIIFGSELPVTTFERNVVWEVINNGRLRSIVL